MIITIDGPAGAGKSSAARELAQRLGFHFLDTGAMYRAVTLAAMEQRVDWSDRRALVQLAQDLQIELSDNTVMLNGRDVTVEIRVPAVTSAVYHVADNVKIRSILVQMQREAANNGDYISEGRDQGTIVFPEAACKFFLTASVETRARRRYEDLLARGVNCDYAEVLAQQQIRDRRDAEREVGRLEAAPDAICIETDGKTRNEVVDGLELIVRQRMRTLSSEFQEKGA